jgi:exosortase D (VPLPA-CTERM-specific)
MEIRVKRAFQIKPFDYIQIGIYAFLIYGIYAWSLHALVIYDWQRDGYSYGYLIPFVVLYFLWLKRNEFRAVESKPSWWGILILLSGLLFFWLGELGGELLTLYVSMWLVVIGLCWLHFGWTKLKIIGFPLFFILTMFPLPVFLNSKLMLQLRLISSKLGVSMIQLYGLPVIREGNIIDLGFVQLQVVEACSGLHSLISLVVLCLLLVYFFKDHIWKRAVLLISSVPLAIFTNSMRIALTAIFHKYFGPDIAQGFFHGFSGLVIFLISVPVLLIEMKILEKLPPNAQKSSSKSSDSEKQPSSRNPDPKEKKISQSTALHQPIFIVAVILLVATFAFSQGIEFREKIPANKSLDQFPLKFANWSAESRQPLAKIYLDALDLSEYIMADYQNGNDKRVSIYVAYYESQNKGQSIHSPASCLPGSGWSFDESGMVSISDIPGNPGTMQVNRAVMQYGRSTQIAYYWFSQRGRILNNAYQLKIYNFWDALTMQRTDGALIRLITPVYENEKLADADYRLQNFVRDIVPVLEEYVPGKNLGESS